MRPFPQIQYIPLNLTISFEKPVEYGVPPAFILRSILGLNLHEICCIAKRNTCPECEHNGSCIYAQVFDTILQKDNQMYHGRNRAPHPFVLYMDDWFRPKENTLRFTVLVLGKAIAYTSYIYGAFLRGQSRGFGRDRIRYTIESISSDGVELLEDADFLNYQNAIKNWVPSDEQQGRTYEGSLLIRLQTPLRFKHQGTYTDTFTSLSLFSCFKRRLETLCLLYGIVEEVQVLPLNFKVLNQMTEWKEYPHYSTRQRRNMFLGGVVGNIELKGEFTQYELDLLSFNELFQAGKNTSFGFGKMSVWRQF